MIDSDSLHLSIFAFSALPQDAHIAPRIDVITSMAITLHFMPSHSSFFKIAIKSQRRQGKKARDIIAGYVDARWYVSKPVPKQSYVAMNHP